MTATYPTSVVDFGPNKVNFTDTILASDANTLRDEVVSIESTIGATPTVSTIGTASGWVNDGRTFSTVVARLANIEKGIVADSHTQYVKNTGASVITPSGAGVVGLAINAAAGQTADLQQWKDSTGAVITRIGSDGYLYVNGIKLVLTTPEPSSFLLGGM